MGFSTRSSGIVAMIVGGVVLAVGFLLVAVSEELVVLALNFMAGGTVLFIVGAVLHDKRPENALNDRQSKYSYKDPEMVA